MSKRAAKSQASSARAATTTFGSAFGGAISSPTFGASSSQLSYIAEPPDLSTITNPNVVVYFRNLSKKDSTTKAKALEEIQAHILTQQDPVEEGILEAWIKLYPRTSIDNAKAVRQSAHILHGHICTLTGKRIARHMPKAIGAWLSGLYDADRAVVEATQSSLRQVFTTPEKIQAIRKAYQKPIFEYCRDAVEKETTLTLSDERTASPDDAEAKYSRVISACIALLGSLLSNLGPEELSKYQDEYDSLLGDAKLWAFATHADPIIRRSVHRFLKTCVQKQTNAIGSNLDSISKAYLATALNSDQIGSAYDYVEALSALTTAHPTAWTEHYKSKTSVDRRLRQFLKKGSQFGPKEFWLRIVVIFQHLPKEVIPASGADTAELLSSIHSGIIRKDEIKSSLETAFIAYLEISDIVLKPLPEEEKQKALDETLVPIIVQYLRPAVETSHWSIPTNSKTIMPRLFAIEGVPSTLERQLPEYTQKFIDDIRTSAPEQSKDYDRSQSALIKQASRFSSIQKSATETVESLRSLFSQAFISIITEALQIIKNRNGKPYGAAGAVSELLHQSNSLVLETTASKQLLESFIEEELPSLITSPSSSYLVDILYSLSGSASFPTAWSASLKACLGENESPARTRALEAILTSPRIPQSFSLASSDPELQRYITSSVQATLRGQSEWDTFNRILQSPSRILAPATCDEVLATLTQSLSATEEAPSALQGFRHIVKTNPTLLKNYISSNDGTSLLRSLLLASESPDEEISRESIAVNASIQTLLSTEETSKQSVFEVIHHGLRDASHSSVTVETLLDLAKRLVKSSDGWDAIANILPKQDYWDSCLSPFLSVAPKPSLAITNPLGGAVYLVHMSESESRPRKLPRDADGYSPAFRIGQFVTKLFKHTDLIDLDQIPVEIRDKIVYNVSLTRQLADDNLGLAGANQLWLGNNPESESEAMAFIEDAQDLINRTLKRRNHQWNDSDDGAAPLLWAHGLISGVGTDISASTYYAARATSSISSDLIELRGWNSSNTTEMQEKLKSLRKSKSIFPLLTFLNAFKEPLAATKSCERFCNELVADLTGLDISTSLEDAIVQLVLLNSLLHGQEDIKLSIAKQRLVFFVKHVLPWLKDDTSPLPIRAELCRTLAILLPLMSDIYGEHWGQILDELASSWSSTSELKENESGMDSPVPFIYGSLKLYAQLRALTQVEDPNDDLIEVWKENEQTIALGLVNLLKHSRHFSDDSHQPLKIVNDVLARQIAKVPIQHLESSEELYPLLYVESQPVQQAAFDILHKQIPAAQEQISIDSALEKTTARLPEELLSLILEPPTVAGLAEASFERNMPLQLRGYLLSWILVFDHLEHASFKVKNDYVDHIKEGEYLPGLLDFMFDFLGHAQNKPADVSKFEVTTYTPDQETPKRDTQWLLTHLYFLCLLHLPSLAKSWYIDCKSRPIVVTLEPWTEKYISPPVVSAALQSVTTWSTTQTTDTDSPFTVKVSPRAREITASYTVDEQTMSMRLSLPPSFPLTPASIEGINRVAVNEQKWQSWLRTSLGAITIFNGSLIDALTTFKRNVDGAMKGQSECAICYSVVGSDRKLPDKKCNTCKNLFHGTCLFKWFRTSGNSSCPLCRNPFNYG